MEGFASWKASFRFLARISDHEAVDRAVASWRCASPVALSVGSPPLPKRHKTGALQNLAGSPKVHGEPPFVFRMHWDHEPDQLVGRGVLTAPRLGGLGTARPTLRFMESTGAGAAKSGTSIGSELHVS